MSPYRTTYFLYRWSVLDMSVGKLVDTPKGLCFCIRRSEARSARSQETASAQRAPAIKREQAKSAEG
jgi:hypothetical protein